MHTEIKQLFGQGTKEDTSLVFFVVHLYIAAKIM